MQDYKVYYKTVLMYWRSKRYKSITVQADNEEDALDLVGGQFKNNAYLAEQIYSIYC